MSKNRIDTFSDDQFKHKKASRNVFLSPSTVTSISFQAAFITAPDLMHLVHTLVFWVFPPALAMCTVFKLGSQRRLVLLCAWDTLLPVTGPLPQISHTFAMFSPSITSPGSITGKRWNV
jgi:hypothetical protein